MLQRLGRPVRRRHDAWDATHDVSTQSGQLQGGIRGCISHAVCALTHWCPLHLFQFMRHVSCPYCPRTMDLPCCGSRLTSTSPFGVPVKP
jgi:hypothetical protein